MDFFLSLVRPRGAFERAGAAPGAPSTAAEGMDGSDDRADGIPGKGKGLTYVTDIYENFKKCREITSSADF